MLRFTPQTIPNNVFIIGCGGTGSRVVPMVTQMMATQEWLIGARLTLVDPDVVETKNTTRQNFIQPDVGRNKAEVLAERYSNAFGLEIVAIPEFIGVNSRLMDRADQLRGKGAGNSAAIFILCVDSAKARREILASLFNEGRASHDSIVIDAGNEDIFGQVSIFNLDAVGASLTKTQRFELANKIEDRNGFNIDLVRIPAPLVEYEYMQDGVGTGSCADLDQTMAINNLMAANILGIFQNILFQIPIEFRRVYISLNGGMSTEWLDNFWLKDLLKNEDNNIYSRGHAIVEKDVPEFNKLVDARNRSNSSGLGVLEAAAAIVARQEQELADALAA